jgi:hypothetical protein
MSDFLPDDYQVPSAADKFIKKLPSGDSKFRILGAAVLGNEFWVNIDGKPKSIRRPMGHPISPSELDADSEIKHFWAVPVWNYASKSVAVLTITQKAIQKALTKLAQNKAWGSPTGYDIVITKSGSGMETSYEAIAEPKTPLDADIEKAWKEVQSVGFDLDAIFSDGDPFAPTSGPITETDLSDLFPDAD